MSGRRGNMSDALARFTSEVQDAVTKARHVAAEAKEESREFRKATEELATRPARPAAPAAPTAARSAPPVVEDEDEDFSQHQIMQSVDRAEDDVDSSIEPAEPVESVTDSAGKRTSDDTRSSEGEDFSQQRILDNQLAESYGPDALPAIGFDLPEPEKPS